MGKTLISILFGLLIGGLVLSLGAASGAFFHFLGRPFWGSMLSGMGIPIGYFAYCGHMNQLRYGSTLRNGRAHWGYPAVWVSCAFLAFIGQLFLPF